MATCIVCGSDSENGTYLGVPCCIFCYVDGKAMIIDTMPEWLRFCLAWFSKNPKQSRVHIDIAHIENWCIDKYDVMHHTSMPMADRINIILGVYNLESVWLNTTVIVQKRIVQHPSLLE